MIEKTENREDVTNEERIDGRGKKGKKERRVTFWMLLNDVVLEKRWKRGMQKRSVPWMELV